MELGYQEMPIEAIDLSESNYKVDDDVMLNKLQKNLKRNGQIENIIVREKSGGRYEVVNGNHRLVALKNGSAKKVMVYNLGKISDIEADRIAIETNETKFAADPLKLAMKLKSISLNLKDDLDSLPYTEEELAAHIGLADFDPASLEVPGITNEGSSKTTGPSFTRTITIRLPKEVADRFEAVLNRIKTLRVNKGFAEVQAEIESVLTVCEVLEKLPDSELNA